MFMCVCFERESPSLIDESTYCCFAIGVGIWLGSPTKRSCSVCVSGTSGTCVSYRAFFLLALRGDARLGEKLVTDL